MKNIAIIIISLSMCFIFGGCSDFADPIPPLTDKGELDISKITKIKLNNLIKEIESNSLATNKKYAGKWIITVGEIEDISQEPFGDGINVIISGSELSTTMLTCQFKEEHKDSVMKLKSGEQLIVCGLFNIEEGLIPYLKHCIVITLK